MLKIKKLCIFLSVCMFSANVSAEISQKFSNQFPLQMQNQTSKDVRISFRNDIGIVYFDIPLEDNTLLPAGQYSYTYGVNYAPRDPNATFKIIFNGEKECIFIVGYFKPPEEPKVRFSGEGCNGAGYRVDPRSGYSPLVLFVTD